MSFPIYIRPLQLEDALTAYQWRNNPKIWELTGSKPDKHITQEMETEWLANVLNRNNEKRFAVCIKATDQYIGNIHLSNITSAEAECSLFIGESELWGKGFGTAATRLLVEYAFAELSVVSLYGFVKKEHAASRAMFKKLGFQSEPWSKDVVRVSLLKSSYQKPSV